MKNPKKVESLTLLSFNAASPYVKEPLARTFGRNPQNRPIRCQTPVSPHGRGSP